MNLSNPIESLLRPIAANALLALARVGPMSGRQVARVISASSASVARTALLELTAIGLVAVDAQPHATIYRLNERHLLWPAIAIVLDARAAFERSISELTDREAHPGTRVMLYGSTARTRSTAASDVDLLVVHPDAAPIDVRDRFTDRLASEVFLLTGNRAEIYDLTAEQLADLVAEDDPLIESWRTDGIALAGSKPNLAADRS